MYTGSMGRYFSGMPFRALPLWLRFAGFGGPWGGPRRGGGPAGWGFGPPHHRRFGRGDLKYVILDLLQAGPRHGYDIIRALEERSHGFYSPSAGSVYPTLQLLEDQGFVTSNQQDGKRVYTITDAGRAFLTERADTVDDIRARMASGWGGKISPELRGLMDEVRQLGQFVFAQGTHGGLGDPDRIRRLRDLVRRTKDEVETIFRGEPDSPNML
jgi:DNA-binding PadR family transcriptional regulator